LWRTILLPFQFLALKHNQLPAPEMSLQSDFAENMVSKRCYSTMQKKSNFSFSYITEHCHVTEAPEHNLADFGYK
jgi:hypothetical protein